MAHIVYEPCHRRDADATCTQLAGGDEWVIVAAGIRVPKRAHDFYIHATCGVYDEIEWSDFLLQNAEARWSGEWIPYSSRLWLDEDDEL